jgi:hypothetical protein
MPSTGRLLSRAAVAGAIAIAAAAAVGAVRARRSGPASPADELDADVRDAIDEGMATGGQGEPVDEAVRWIPLNGHGAERGAAAVPAPEDTPATASA